MRPDEFRELALALPGTVEAAHMGHADFRVGGKIFASLGYPDDGWGMVKLTAAGQEVRIGALSSVFRAANGAWGRRGSTLVRLAEADPGEVEGALREAWRNAAPMRRPSGSVRS